MFLSSSLKSSDSLWQNREGLLLTWFRWRALFKWRVNSTSASFSVCVWAENTVGGVHSGFYWLPGRRRFSCCEWISQLGTDSDIPPPTLCFSNTASQSFEQHFAYCGISLNVFIRMRFFIRMKTVYIYRVKFTSLEIVGIWRFQWKVNVVHSRWWFAHSMASVSVIWVKVRAIHNRLICG